MQETFVTELADVRPRILALARKFLRSSGLRLDAEDLAQDALLRLWTALADGTEIRNPEAWAVRTVKNLCISHLRREHGRSVTALPESLPAPESASAPLETAESRRRIDRALEHLPAGTRQLLRLRAAGMSLDEIAAATGRPKNSIKSSISAARKQLLNEIKSTS